MKGMPAMMEMPALLATPASRAFAAPASRKIAMTVISVLMIPVNRIPDASTPTIQPPAMTVISVLQMTPALMEHAWPEEPFHVMTETSVMVRKHAIPTVDVFRANR
jgi:hypothetical protein